MRKHYIISYRYDKETSELHLSVFEGEKTVYTTHITGGFGNKENTRRAILKILSGRGYSPYFFEEDLKEN